MIDTAARVQDFLSALEVALAGSNLDGKENVTITADGRDVLKAFSLTAGAIVVYPLPALEWPAPRVVRVTWTFAVVALAQDGPAGAADRVNQLVEILRTARLIVYGDRAVPTDFKTDPAENTVPGYTITHTEEHYA